MTDDGWLTEQWLDEALERARANARVHRCWCGSSTHMGGVHVSYCKLCAEICHSRADACSCGAQYGTIVGTIGDMVHALGGLVSRTRVPCSLIWVESDP